MFFGYAHMKMLYVINLTPSHKFFIFLFCVCYEVMLYCNAKGGYMSSVNARLILGLGQIE
jgi:hypothetical protein